MRPSVRLRSVAFGQDPVQGPASLAKQRRRARDLRVVASHEDLASRDGDLSGGGHEGGPGTVLADLRALPRPTELLAILGDERPTRVGQPVRPTTFGRRDRDESLILELLQDGIDRPGARTPHLLGALAELLDELVAVAVALFEQYEDRRADVTAPLATTSTAPSTSVVVPRPETVCAGTAALTIR